ncbi:hypothetical protein BUALT_Bualt12G0051500 [Buddleja alternifolia]|uniref:Uncharacterized protein n=1 Tax=Buddleja alternifolia TaxID=168488 RepID=A0AAV6WMQ5_9LAMI|nr:hypothetical protein BUALT_Bualt12G0051500 [Buddleja alternifolia]
MAEAQKKDSSSVSLKEKTSMLDLDIGKDFLSNWKSMSMAEGDGMDFDLTPVSKGNKKSFAFDKSDMDFNLDGDFGKMSSFNMDMSDLDISPPLKKDGKSKEKSKESSSGKDKGKADHFGFAFDFDELENFNFESSLTKEGSKAQKDKDKEERSPSESGCQAKESSMDMNQIGNMSTLEDRPQKPSLTEPMIPFDMDCLGGGIADLEPKSKIFPSKLAMDDVVTSEHSAEIDEVASDKAKIPPETTTASRELSKSCHQKPVDLEACIGNNAMQELSFDSLSNSEPSRGNSSEALEKTDCADKIAIASNGEQDVNVHSIDGSTCSYNHTVTENSEHLQTVAILEKNNDDKSQGGIDAHVIDNEERTDLGSVNPLVKNTYITSAVSGILSDTTPSLKNQESTLENLKLPLVSQPADRFLSEKESESGREPLVTLSRTSIHPEKPECPVQKASTQATVSSLSSKKMGFTQNSLVEGRRDWTSIQSDKKLASLPLQHSKTLLRRELPQVQSQESCKGLKISREVCSSDGLQNGKRLNDSSTTLNKDMVKRTALGQRETIMKDVDTLSSSIEISKISARNSDNPTTLASLATIKNNPAEEDKLSSVGGGKKTPDLCGLKLSNLNLGSTKSPTRKDIKPVGSTSQNTVLLRNTGINTTRFANLQKQSPSTLSMKRKTLEEYTANAAVLHPSKRPFQSPTTSRNFVETSQRVLDKKIPNHNNIEDDRIKSTLGNSQASAYDIPHEVKIKEVEISFSIQNDSNIKQAEAYTKELDDVRINHL